MKRPVSESGLKFKSLFEKIKDVQQDNSPSSSFSRGEASSSFAIKDLDYENPEDREKHESGRLPQPLTNDLIEYFKELLTENNNEIGVTNLKVETKNVYENNIPFQTCFLYLRHPDNKDKIQKLFLKLNKFNKSIINDSVLIYFERAAHYNYKYLMFTPKNYETPENLKNYTRFKTLE